MFSLTGKIFIYLLTLLIGTIGFSLNNKAIALSPIKLSLGNFMIHEVVIRQAEAWEDSDAEAIIADFAENASFIVPGSTFSGKEAIKTAAKDYFAQFHQTKVEIIRVIAEGDRGAVEWTWQDENKTTKEKSYAEDAIILELRDGKIIYWREYIDKTVNQKLI